MKFNELFEKYWDNLIIGIISGLVVYIGLDLENVWKSIMNIFFLGLFLIGIYTLIVWIEKKYDLDKKFLKYPEDFSKNIRLKKIDKKLAYKYIKFVIVVVLLSFISYCLYEFQLLHSLFVILSIIVSSGILFILYMVQKDPKDNLDNISLFIFLIALILVISTVYVSIPDKVRGSNKEPLNVSFDFYIVNEEISKDKLLEYVEGANKIWNNYNISIVVRSVNHVNINLTDKEREFLYEGISGDDSKKEKEKICNESYMPMINNITKNESEMSIIFIEGEGSSGRGHLCGYKFAVFDQEKCWLRDLTDWNLAHEIGHVLGLSHPKNHYKVNLMTDNHKLFWRSSFLKQEQINSVKNKIKNIREQ